MEDALQVSAEKNCCQAIFGTFIKIPANINKAIRLLKVTAVKLDRGWIMNE